jgi:hypothetical protein
MSERDSQSSSSSNNSDTDSAKEGCKQNAIHSKFTPDDSTIHSNATSATRVEQRRKKRQNRKNKKSQHTLDYLRQYVSKLMSIFETNGWFIPLPDSMNEDGKVWSNRNYGADKKRRRKHSERNLLEARICQLESVLKMEHDVDDFEK